MATTMRRNFGAMEKRRRRGMELLAAGVTQAAVARRLGVTPATVCKWNHKRAQGPRAWMRGRLGRPVKVNAKHRKTLARVLKQSAQAHGFLTDRWTLPRIAAVLEREAGVRVHPGHLWRVLGAMGSSVQRPERRAVPRGDQAITRRQRHTRPALNKKRGGKGAPSSSSRRAN